MVGIFVYLLVIFWAYGMESEWEFYVLAVAIGLVQGGVQSLSRALYSQLIPPERSAEFFGFYNMLGKFAAVIGPIMVGWVSVLSGSPKIAMLSLLVLFVGGALVLSPRLRPARVRVCWRVFARLRPPFAKSANTKRYLLF